MGLACYYPIDPAGSVILVSESLDRNGDHIFVVIDSSITSPKNRHLMKSLLTRPVIVFTKLKITGGN